MIAKINGQGHSFKGVTAYLMHDKDAQSHERLAWHETGNMLTNDLERAANVMAWTDSLADDLKAKSGISKCGRPVTTGAVYHYSLSWAQGEKPSEDHQREQALATIAKLGLGEHEYYMVAHNDTEHAHVHIVANLTHPENGTRASMKFTKNDLQEWALSYEKEHGIVCPDRLENLRKREAGEQTKHRDKKQDYSQIVTQAYQAADTGKAFLNALEEQGLTLAAARRGAGFVLVDEHGDIQKLTRQLDIDTKGKAKTEAINTKLSDIERETLPDPDQIAKARKSQDIPPTNIETPAIHPVGEIVADPATSPRNLPDIMAEHPPEIAPEDKPEFKQHMQQNMAYEQDQTQPIIKPEQQPEPAIVVKAPTIAPDALAEYAQHIKQVVAYQEQEFTQIPIYADEELSKHISQVVEYAQYFKNWVAEKLTQGYDYMQDMTATILRRNEEKEQGHDHTR